LRYVSAGIFLVARTRLVNPAGADRHLLIDARFKLQTNQNRRVRCVLLVILAGWTFRRFPNRQQTSLRFPTQTTTETGLAEAVPSGKRLNSWAIRIGGRKKIITAVSFYSRRAKTASASADWLANSI
jgi:hypothetical protein